MGTDDGQWVGVGVTPPQGVLPEVDRVLPSRAVEVRLADDTPETRTDQALPRMEFGPSLSLIDPEMGRRTGYTQEDDRIDTTKTTLKGRDLLTSLMIEVK